MRDTALIEKLIEQTPAGDGFYTPPGSLHGMTHGEPIYLRTLENTFSVPDGGENWLVLYRSESAGARPAAVATSGIIVLPDRDEHPVPDGGYPLITWCHGTVGCANRVAPSRDTGDTGASPMNAYPKTMLRRFLDQGWAVAMTDYEGLGTGTNDGSGTGIGPGDKLHPYLLGQSEARAALDIVLAARHLFRDEISAKFAIVGHSQGGQAALFTAANAAGRVSGLVGVAAIAPANHPLDIVRAGATPLNVFKSDGYAFSALFLAGAIGGSVADHADGDPACLKVINPRQVLSDKAIAFWPEVWNLSRAELGANEQLFGSLQGNEQFRLGYLVNPNADQREFNRQLTKMNPEVAIPAPIRIRISQALEDKRVQYQPESPLTGPFPGTEALITELKDRNPGRVDPVIYDATKVDNSEQPLQAHFTTINVDTGPLIDWLIDQGLEDS